MRQSLEISIKNLFEFWIYIKLKILFMMCNTQGRPKAPRKVFAQLRTPFVIWIDKGPIRSIRLQTLRVRAATLRPYMMKQRFVWISSNINRNFNFNQLMQQKIFNNKNFTFESLL